MSIKQAIEALEVAQDALDISQSLQESAKSNHHPKTLAAYERVSADLAALRSMPQGEPAPVEPKWIVNDMGELGVQVAGHFYFLYKGDNIVYGEEDSPFALHDDGTPMKYRMVGKREFGEVCHPLKWLIAGRTQDRYTEELVYTPGLSFGKPEDGAWKELPAATPHTEAVRMSEAWISVDERLPNPWEDVLIYPRPTDYCCEGQVDHKGQWTYSEYEQGFGDVTHKIQPRYWQPLPPPPVEQAARLGVKMGDV